METKKIKINQTIFMILGVLVLFGLDQWTKQLAVVHLQGQEDITLIPGVLQLHYLENRGAAFGLMQNHIWIFVILTLAFLVLAAYVYVKMPKTKRFLPLHVIEAILFAGAIGNLADRIRLNYVIDFIYFSLINFPVFNVADIYVTVSAVLLFIYVIFYYKEEDFQFFAGKKQG